MQPSEQRRPSPLGQPCPDCGRVTVGYQSQRGSWALYCLIAIRSFKDGNQPPVTKVLLGFRTHQRSKEGKEGFWVEANRVQWGPLGIPPRHEWERICPPRAAAPQAKPATPTPAEELGEMPF